VLLGTISCNRYGHNAPATLSAVFTETASVNDRATLNFVNGTAVIKTETGSAVV